MEPETNKQAPAAEPAAPAAPPVAPAALQPDLEPVPANWPGGFGLYKYSKAAVKFNLGTIATIILIWVALSIIVSAAFGGFDTESSSSGPDNIVQLLISAVLSPALTFALFAGIDRQKLGLGEAFSKGGPVILKYFLQSILIGVIAVLSLIALIVPFFFIMPRLVLAPYFLIRKSMGITESMSASWEQTKGNVGKVYGIVGVYILIFLLFFTLIGIPFALYFCIMYAAALAILYAFIVENVDANADEPAFAEAAPQANESVDSPSNTPPQAPAV